MSYPQINFQFTQFSAGSFISRRREVVYSNTLLYQLDVLKNTGRYDAFKLQWHPSYGDPPNVWPVPNHLFWDSDVAKWIEGACYFLQWKDNPVIDSAIKELVEMIRSAQQPDGYLNIHFTVVEPQKRFTNLRDLHELYNAGHLIEAALAHNQFYKNDLLLEPILKYVELLCDTFGPGTIQKHGYPGHPEIELALLRLYEKTQNPRHIALAKYFVEERGNSKGQDGHYYDVEAKLRGENENMRPVYYPEGRSYWYQQAHKPILEQETIEGHSVRAMYLLSAVADLARIQPAQEAATTKSALHRLWSNMVDKKMYLTGGIGAIKKYEGFGIDYFLPQGTDEGGCYSETCAAIGVMMLAERLLQIDLDGVYADIMELCFFNAVATAMSSCGKKFTYVNQLASSDTDLSKRADWFTCACCPPNMTRLLGYIGGYLWTSNADLREKKVQINVHIYSSATLTIPFGGRKVEIEQKSNWPWEGDVEFAVKGLPDVETSIKLRIPGWAKDWSISPSLSNPELQKGYLILPASYLHKTPTFKLQIRLSPRIISPHPYTNQNTVALARGPIIYCVEDFDNPWVNDHFKSLYFNPTAKVTERLVSESVIPEPWIELTASKEAISLLSTWGADGPHAGAGDEAQRKSLPAEELKFIPYCLRDNRGGKGHMRVGLRRMH